MGLIHPSSLPDWQAWAQRRHRLRSTVGAAVRLTRRDPADPAPRLELVTAGPAPDLLVAIDSTSPSNRAALLAPLDHLDPARVAVLGPVGIGAVLADPADGRPTAQLARTARSTGPLTPDDLPSLRVVLTAGHYLPAGVQADALARDRGLPQLVVEHGLLTPHAPPLPQHATLLAWSAADADFWRSGRPDVETAVVGSQLLWAASHRLLPAPAEGTPPVYLGQLHAAELSRRGLAAAAYRFCRQHDATYRPHPAERDRRSRARHAWWQRRGIRIDRGGRPLGQPPAPVVSVFSTGVLEAAARGLPAWVEHPDPPAWLERFWDRYRMSRWGDRPTPRPARPATEPAAAVAAHLRALADR